MSRTITIDGTDRTSVARLEDVIIEMKAKAGEVGAGSLALDDTTGTANPSPAMTVWRITESAATPTTIGAGYISEREVDRGPLTVATQRQFEPVLEDMNAALGDRVLRGIKSKRPKETDVERVLWLLRSKGLRNLVVRGQVPASTPDPVDMDKADYRGRYPFEVLQECAEESDRDFFVYWDADKADWALCYDSAALGTSTLSITDVAADVDGSTVFGASSIEYRLDPGRVYSGMYVKWRDGYAYARRAATQATYRRREKTVTRNRFRSATRARNWARKQLLKLDVETTELTLTVSVPASALGELRAGMRIPVKLTSRGITDYTNFRIVTATITPRTGDAGVSDVEYDVRLEMRDKVRVVDLSADHPRGGSDRAGSGKDDQGETSRTDDHLIDDFARVVSEPTWEEGDALGVSLTELHARRGVNVNGVEQPFVLDSGSRPYVASYVGDWYLRTGDSGYACDYPQADFRGWWDREVWWSLTIPAHPAGMAGLTISVQPYGADGSGYGGGGRATIDGVEVVVRDSAPTDTWQGTPVGVVSAFGSYTDVFVPGAYVPAQGGTLWVGVRPNWRCDYEANQPYCDYPLWPYDTGIGNSGRCQVSASAGAWATWVSEGDDFGTIATSSDTGAPWDGGNEWRDAGTEGSPTYGVDGQAYYVTAEAPGGHGIYVVGPEEDEDEPPGPWSDSAWAVELLFEVDALGNSSAGRRDIEVRTVGDLATTVGRVHLGDATRAAGISVRAPTTVDYAAKSLTAGALWHARFDSRSGKLRGKMWQSSTLMPAAWDVECDIDETADDGDRFELWVRVGNGTGNIQTARIHRIEAARGARDDMRIVRELIGHASGDEHTFATSHQFREGTLRFYIGGVKTAPKKEWGDDAEARVDFQPTEGMKVRATYIVD